MTPSAITGTVTRQRLRGDQVVLTIGQHEVTVPLSELEAHPGDVVHATWYRREVGRHTYEDAWRIEAA